MATQPAARGRLVIPKVMSRPADPSAPSFLTSLPPEVRNHIYKFLFQQKDPIPLICDICDTAQEYADRFLIGSYEWRESLEDRENDLDLVLPLLRSCRQVYHEAVQIVYSGNTWLFTRPPHHHDHHYNQIKLAPLWISGIGSNFDMVKRIVIDADRICPNECRHCPRELDFLPLAKLFWSRERDDLEIIFDLSGKQLQPELHQSEGADDDLTWTFGDCSLLDNIFEFFVTRDSGQLRRYARFPRLLKGIVLDRPGMTLNIRYQEPFPSLCLPILNDGKELGEDEEDSRKHQLKSLPANVYQKILALSCISSEGIKIDLNSRKTYGLDFNANNIRSMREGFKRVIHASTITYMLSTTEGKTSFENFEALREWHNNMFPQYPTGTYEHGRMGEEKAHNLVFEFHVAPKTSFSDIEMNIKHLAALQKFMPLGGRATFRKIGPGSESEYTVDLRLLYRRVFVSLSDMFFESPDTRFETNLDIWINGFGQVTRLVAHDTESSVFDAKTNRDRNPASAESAASLRTNEYVYLFVNSGLGSTHMLSGAEQLFLWRSLCRRCWPNEDMRLDWTLEEYRESC